MIWTAAGRQLSAIPQANIIAGTRRAWPISNPFISEISSSDDYGHLFYDGIPATALRVHLGDPQGTWLHVDAADGQIVEIVNSRRRIYRWLFNGLYTFDVPGLEQHDLIRKLVMLPLLMAGFSLSISGVVLGFRRLRRSL